jgi:hypothetical protein
MKRCLLAFVILFAGLISAKGEHAQTAEGPTWKELLVKHCPQVVAVGNLTVEAILATKKVKFHLSEDQELFVSEVGCRILAHYYHKDIDSPSPSPIIKPGAKVDPKVLCRYVTDLEHRCPSPAPERPFEGYPRLRTKDIMRGISPQQRADQLIGECDHSKLDFAACLEKGEQPTQQ